MKPKYSRMGFKGGDDLRAVDDFAGFFRGFFSRAALRVTRFPSRKTVALFPRFAGRWRRYLRLRPVIRQSLSRIFGFSFRASAYKIVSHYPIKNYKIIHETVPMG
jgi:hypothetical protein